MDFECVYDVVKMDMLQLETQCIASLTGRKCHMAIYYSYFKAFTGLATAALMA